jgi:hypothetical protein
MNPDAQAIACDRNRPKWQTPPGGGATTRPYPEFRSARVRVSVPRRAPQPYRTKLDGLAALAAATAALSLPVPVVPAHAAPVNYLAVERYVLRVGPNHIAPSMGPRNTRPKLARGDARGEQHLVLAQLGTRDGMIGVQHHLWLGVPEDQLPAGPDRPSRCSPCLDGERSSSTHRRSQYRC